MSSDVGENPSTEQADRTRRVDATERESRAVVEAAREKGWERPSFARASTFPAAKSTPPSPGRPCRRRPR